MDKNLFQKVYSMIFRLLKRESKELYYSLEMRRPQNLEEKELLKKLRITH